MRFLHPGQAFETTIDGAEVRVAPTTPAAWSFSLSTSTVGCVDSQVAVPKGRVDAAGNRVELVRESVREWYVNGPLGLERGFTLEQRPACSGTKVITIDVHGDARPQLVDHASDGPGQTLAFVDAAGMRIANYTDL